MSVQGNSYCACSDSELESAGARRSENTYYCQKCGGEIAIARIWGFDVAPGPDGVSLKKKAVGARATTAKSGWASHANRAMNAARAVEGYVSIVSVLTYLVCGILVVVGIMTEAWQVIPVALLLAALQFVWGASIRMITAYIMFRTAQSLENR